METTREIASSVCAVCKKPGARWSCQRKGCNRKYHTQCVKKCRPDDFVTVGMWNCVDCIKEKLLYGASFACNEVESIWDVMHGDSETQYLVKYKNLAHMHNCWIPESKLRLEIPELVDRFIQEYKKDIVITWNKEWTKPERLLLRRKLMHVDVAQKFFQGPGCQLHSSNTEWLVKWKGLGYEHATWEVGSLKVLCSCEAKRLKQEYNDRQVGAARRAKFASEYNKIKRDPFVRLEAFLNGVPDDLNDGYLDSLNRLLQFWHKSRNAVLIDQEERVKRIVLFIKCMVDHIAQPFLILSPMKSLSLWEEMIRQLIPSVNTVVHTNSSKFASSLVERTEFWGQGGHLLFQVFLSTPDAMEGLGAIKQISWEGVIVDQCDNVNWHLEKIKTLSDFKIIVLNTLPKDDPSQFVKLLSVLEMGDAYPVPDISILKEKFLRYVVYQREINSSNCETIPVVVEKAQPLSEVLDKRDCCQHLSSVVNLRKRKKSVDDVVDLSFSHGMIINKKRACVEKPTSTGILEFSCEEHMEILGLQVANSSLSFIETDAPKGASLSVAKITNQIMDKKESKRIVVWKDGTRTIHVLLKPRLLRLYEMLGIPENVNSVANNFYNHVLKSHKAMRTPFIVPKSNILGPLEVVLRYNSSSGNGLCEQFLHWFKIANRIFMPYLPRLGYYNPLTIITKPDAHREQMGPQEITLEHKIDRICAGRESTLCALQKKELDDLQMRAEREGTSYWRTFNSVVKNMHAMTTSEKRSNLLLEKTIQKFKAFQEHVACQRTKLKLLQEKVRASEKLGKEKWIKMIKSGKLKYSFDFSRIPLPDSGFVYEKFDWVYGERAMNCGVSSSQENVLKKRDNSQPTVRDLPLMATGAINSMEGSHRVQPHVSAGRQCDVHSNTNLDKGSTSAIFNLALQQEIDASPPNYTGASALSDESRISQQLDTNFMAEQTPVIPEELLECASMLLEPEETEINTHFASDHASMPDIGISPLSRPDVLLESSNDFLEMPPFTREMFPEGLNVDPLVNELTRMTHWKKDLSKKLDEKKLQLRSQLEGEIQSIRRKYDERNKEDDANFRKHKKFLQSLICKAEGGQTVARELRAFELAAESDMLLQDWNQLSPQKTPHQSEPAFMNCTSASLSTCMPPHLNTQPLSVGICQAPPTITNQAPSVQTESPPLTINKDPAVPFSLTSGPSSTSSASHILISDGSSISASLGSTPVSAIQMPRIPSNQASTKSTNLASPQVSTVHAADDSARLGPHISHMWSQPTQTMNCRQLLSWHTMGMSPSPVWASSVQNSRAPIRNTTPVSPVQVPHIRADLPPPRWTSVPRPTSTNSVRPVVASRSHHLSSMVAQTRSPIQPTHLQIGWSQSVMRSPTPSVLTSWAPPVQNTPPYMLVPPPHLNNLQSHVPMGRPPAPGAPLSDLSNNARNFGGSISNPNWRHQSWDPFRY